MSKRTISFSVEAFIETRDEWRVTVSGDPDPVFSFHLVPAKAITTTQGSGWEIAPWRHLDAFQVRDRLLEINGVDDAKRFFEAFGPWRLDKIHGCNAPPISYSTVLQRKAFFEDALQRRCMGSPEGKDTDSVVAWTVSSSPFWPLEVTLLLGESAGCEARCKDCGDAVRAAVFLSAMEGLTWFPCARTGCKRIWEQVDKRRKRFCSEACAHHQAVIDYNGKKGTGSTQSKATARKGTKSSQSTVSTAQQEGPPERKQQPRLPSRIQRPSRLQL